jgi:hypothetical protein
MRLLIKVFVVLIAVNLGVFASAMPTDFNRRISNKSHDDLQFVVVKNTKINNKMPVIQIDDHGLKRQGDRAVLSAKSSAVLAGHVGDRFNVFNATVKIGRNHDWTIIRLENDHARIVGKMGQCAPKVKINPRSGDDSDAVFLLIEDAAKPSRAPSSKLPG